MCSLYLYRFVLVEQRPLHTLYHNHSQVTPFRFLEQDRSLEFISGHRAIVVCDRQRVHEVFNDRKHTLIRWTFTLLIFTPCPANLTNSCDAITIVPTGRPKESLIPYAYFDSIDDSARRLRRHRQRHALRQSVRYLATSTREHKTYLCHVADVTWRLIDLLSSLYKLSTRLKRYMCIIGRFFYEYDM